MIQLIVAGVAILAIVSGIGAYTLHVKNSAIESYQAQIVKAEDDLRIAEQKRQQEAENKITDMEAAYQAGESNAKTVVKTVYVRGQQNVAKDTALSNPACVMSDDSLHYLVGALTGMRTASAPSGTAATVPGSGTANGGIIRGAVSANPQEHGTVGPVHEAPRSDGGNLPLPAAGGTGVSKPPKPKPIQ